MSRRFWIILALLALGGLGVFYFARANRSSVPPEEVEIVTVQRGTLVSTVSAAGRVEAAEDQTLSFLTSGWVAEILVTEGDLVEEGQVLASLDTTEVELQIDQAEAAYNQARSRLAQIEEGPSADEVAVAEAQLELARLNLQQAQSAWDVVKWRPEASMLPQGIALQQATIEYQQAVANYNLAVAGPSEEEIIQARLEIERTRAALQQAQIPYGNSYLRVPFSGVVAEVFIQELETVSPGLPVVRLLDLSQLWVELDVDEVDLGQMQIGQSAVVNFDALPDLELEGRVDFISPTAKVEGGVVTYTVRVLLDDHDPLLRVGMTANADIETQRIENALLIPNRAVIVDRETGKFYVEKVTPTGSEVVEIEPGATNESYTQVLAGLAEGDQIIIRPISGQELFRGTFGLGGEE